jgi:hypothetical protein
VSLRLSAAAAGVAAVGVLFCAGSSLAGGNPANVDLAKRVDGATKCFTISLTDGSGAPASGYVSITMVQTGGKHSAQGTSYGISTHGTYDLCFGGGSSLPPDSDINAYADINGNGTQDPGEPSLTATAQ